MAIPKLAVRWASWTYEECLTRLMQIKRIFMPWHTEDNPEDPFNVLLACEAYRMARDGSLWNVVATEGYWLTLWRRSSAVALAWGAGYRLSAAVPARVLDIARVTSMPTLPAVLVPAGAQVSTEGDDTYPAVVFEAVDDVAVASDALQIYFDPATKDVYFGHPSMLPSGVLVSAAAYAVGATYHAEIWDSVSQQWVAAAGVTDGSAHLSKAGAIAVPPLQQFSASQEWAPTIVDGSLLWWVRMRCDVVGTGLATPAGLGVTPWYAPFWCLQGQSVAESLGTTDGTAFQRFKLNQTPFIEGSIDTVLVGTDASWVQVDSFLTYGATAKVYRLIELADGYYLEFGDSVNGAKPTVGLEVQARYRIGADSDGNVGANTVTANRAGTSRLADFTNPRAATGWIAPEASTAESLARTRELVPATLRALGRAVTLEDHETLAVRWTTSDGRKPVARAIALQDGVGPRSVLLLVVGAAGADLSAEDLVNLGIYFNGQRRGTQRIGGVAMKDCVVTVENAVRHNLTYTSTIRVLRRFSAGAKAAAEAAVTGVLSPLAVDGSDGVTYLWWPSASYGNDRIRAAIIAACPGFVDFTSMSPSSFTLATEELPHLVTVTVTVVEV